MKFEGNELDKLHDKLRPFGWFVNSGIKRKKQILTEKGICTMAEFVEVEKLPKGGKSFGNFRITCQYNNMIFKSDPILVDPTFRISKLRLQQFYVYYDAQNPQNHYMPLDELANDEMYMIYCRMSYSNISIASWSKQSKFLDECLKRIDEIERIEGTETANEITIDNTIEDFASTAIQAADTSLLPDNCNCVQVEFMGVVDHYGENTAKFHQFFKNNPEIIDKYLKMIADPQFNESSVTPEEFEYPPPMPPFRIICRDSYKVYKSRPVPLDPTKYIEENRINYFYLYQDKQKCNMPLDELKDYTK